MKLPSKYRSYPMNNKLWTIYIRDTLVKDLKKAAALEEIELNALLTNVLYRCITNPVPENVIIPNVYQMDQVTKDSKKFNIYVHPLLILDCKQIIRSSTYGSLNGVNHYLTALFSEYIKEKHPALIQNKINN